MNQRCSVPCVLDIPVIETARLRLRGHTAADYPACIQLWANAEVNRYIGGKPKTKEEIWSRFLRYVGHWSVLGYGYWLVEERHSGEFVGEVGLADYKRMMEPPLVDGTPEVGWVIAPNKQGKGYATEAVGAALDWASAHLGQREMACMIHPDNVVSIGVAIRCGFVEAHRGTYAGEPTIILTFDPRNHRPDPPAA